MPSTKPPLTSPQQSRLAGESAVQNFDSLPKEVLENIAMHAEKVGPLFQTSRSIHGSLNFFIQTGKKINDRLKKIDFANNRDAQQLAGLCDDIKKMPLRHRNQFFESLNKKMEGAIDQSTSDEKIFKSTAKFSFFYETALLMPPAFQDRIVDKLGKTIAEEQVRVFDA